MPAPAAWPPTRCATPPGAGRLVVALTAVAAVAILGWVGLLLASAAAFLYWLLRRALMGRLGGFTGDTAGAFVELTEALLILVLAVI